MRKDPGRCQGASPSELTLALGWRGVLGSFLSMSSVFRGKLQHKGMGRDVGRQSWGRKEGLAGGAGTLAPGHPTPVQPLPWSRPPGWLSIRDPLAHPP